MPSSSSGTVLAPPVRGVPVPTDASMQALHERSPREWPLREQARSEAPRDQAPHEQPPREDESPLLLRAARSMAAAGRAHTVVDVLHARALRHYAEGLEQFLALRLGSVEAAELALRKVRVVVAAHESDELVRPPGIRARLYRIAREIALRERATEAALPAIESSGSVELAASPLPWREAHGTRRLAKLQALRETLDPIDAELLELRYARELRPTELAFVVERDVADVLEHLHAATERAAKLVLERPGERLRSLLLEAFALRGRSPTLRDESLPAGPAPLAPAALVGGRYRVQARVGTGAFGDVYRAEDIEVPGHVVALKLLHQPSYSADTKQAALRELRHLASVFHPSVVSLKDHGWFDGRLWFVMPWYDGETLESRLERGPLTRVEARRIFEPLARALAAVHEAGLRHQDVKPENVFLARMPGFEDDVLPVLIDLGVAATDAEMLVAGTPTYFAPEVAAQFASGVTDKPRVTNKADVFSLALALRNALEPDTQEDVPGGAIESFIEARAVSVPPLPDARSLRFLRGALQRWMSLDPEARPSATELANELAVLTAPEDRRRKRRALWRWLLPTLVVLGSLAAGSVLHVRALAAEETARAAARVAAVREDLEATELERRRLAADAESIRATLDDERLGREELQTRLVDTSASLNARRAELARTRERVAAIEQERATLEATRVGLESTLRTRSTELSTLQGQLGALVAELERERGTRQRLREELSRTQDTRDDLDAQIASERARRAAADTRATELERELDAAIRARQAAERALRDARATGRSATSANEPGSEPAREAEPTVDDPQFEVPFD